MRLGKVAVANERIDNYALGASDDHGMKYTLDMSQV